MTKRADPSTIGIKIGLARKGCENLSYTMNYTDKVEKFDEVLQLEKDIKVIIDSKAVMYLIGTEMDFTSNELLSEFTFKNPNQKSACGCGKSFSV
jgi:iron-sulfur cluster assembly accessory protein